MEHAHVGVEEMPAAVVVSFGDAMMRVFVERREPDRASRNSCTPAEDHEVRRQLRTAAVVIAVHRFDGVAAFAEIGAGGMRISRVGVALALWPIVGFMLSFALTASRETVPFLYFQF